MSDTTIHRVSKKFPPLNSFMSNLNRLSIFCTAGTRMKFATKYIRNCPSHLRHAATLPWEIKNSNFLQIWKKMQTNCIIIASNFASRSPYWLQIKFFNSLLFYLFTFAINLWQWKFVTADVTAVSVNNQHGMKWRGQDFEKNFYL